MAGNIKECAWNETGNQRYILGGAWNEPTYLFATEDAALPFSRSATFRVSLREIQLSSNGAAYSADQHAHP